MIRVLHIDTERTWRGGEAQVFGLARHLPENTFQSIIAAPRKSPLLEKSEAAGIPVLPLTGTTEFSTRMLLHILFGLRHYPIDIIHVHTSHGLIVADAARRLIRRSVPIVYSRRTDFRLRTRFFNLSRLKYTLCADRILTVSRAIQSILIADGIPESRIQTVYSGIDTQAFKPGPDRAALRRELGIPSNVKVVGMVGALVDHKDPMLFLRAAERVCASTPNTMFILVGAGRLWDRLVDSHAASKLGARFLMTGFEPNVLRYLEAFDLFCMTSKEEGLCTSILDAMAMRLPVVATRAGGIPEAVEDGVTGLLADIGDPDSVASRIREILSDDSLASQMGQAGRQRVETWFDIRQTALSTSRVYLGLLESSST